MKKILIVDDANYFRKKTEKFLMNNGFTVVMAENGEQAIKKYKEESPDLVLMDITMPEIDGITATKIIIEYDSQAKVCMLSCMGQGHIIEACREAGADDFIEKPYDDDKLLAYLKRTLEEI